VSGVGDDANPCSRTAPCKTFAGSIVKTATGGEINCIDPGGFGQVTITKSITIRCVGNPETGITASGGPAITINAAGGSVVLEGLDLEGLGNSGSPGTNGINFINGASLVVRKSNIRGFRNGYGINFAPQSANATLLVEDVIINDGGSTGSTTTGGMNIAPAAGMTAQVTLNNVTVANNLNVGLRVDTTGIVGSKIVATITDSRFVNDGSGILVKTPASTGTAAFMLTNSTVSQNASYGIIINGAATARVGNTTVTGNGTGVLLLGGAVLNTYGDNRLNGNTTDGAFTLPAIAKQ